jgi:hypothetical protein
MPDENLIRAEGVALRAVRRRQLRCGAFTAGVACAIGIVVATVMVVVCPVDIEPPTMIAVRS